MKYTKSLDKYRNELQGLKQSVNIVSHDTLLPVTSRIPVKFVTAVPTRLVIAFTRL